VVSGERTEVPEREREREREEVGGGRSEFWGESFLLEDATSFCFFLFCFLFLFLFLFFFLFLLVLTPFFNADF